MLDAEAAKRMSQKGLSQKRNCFAHSGFARDGGCVVEWPADKDEFRAQSECPGHVGDPPKATEAGTSGQAWTTSGSTRKGETVLSSWRPRDSMR